MATRTHNQYLLVLWLLLSAVGSFSASAALFPRKRHTNNKDHHQDTPSSIHDTLLTTTTTTTTTTRSNSREEEEGFSKLVAWMRTQGGRVDDRLVTQEVEGVRGGVARADIEEGAVLLHCPWDLVIGSHGVQPEDQMQDKCDVVRALETELRLGTSSRWHVYLDLHHESLMSAEAARLPTLWGPAALHELQGLPPRQDAQRHTYWLVQNCGGQPTDPVTLEALLCFVTRSTAVGMVPIYDLLNHHNGERNVKLNVSENGVQLVALESIPEGRPLYLSYGVKSAPTMYRDYGFLEPWPQIWTWTDSSPTKERHTFALFPPNDDEHTPVGAIYPTHDFLSTFWREHLSLREFQAMATAQTLDLPRELLLRFQTAATDLLNSLATTVEQDRMILEEMTRSKELLLQKLEQEVPGGGADTKLVELQDSISAVEYRIVFKEAVRAGLVVSEAALLQQAADGAPTGLEGEL